MADYVAVDTATPPGGDQFFTVGAVIEIDDLEAFRESYFDTISNFVDSNGLETPFKVIKSRTAVERLPSYQIRDRVDKLVDGLVANPGISRMNVAIGWYGTDVELEFKGDSENPINGNTFASNYLSQYFNIVALWRYHQSHDFERAETALIDNVQGHVTKAWKYCGKTFDMSLVPNGDLIYPSISTADIIAYNLATFLSGHEEDKFTNFPNLAEDFLIKRRDSSVSPYVKAEVVNERYTDHIVPTLPYTIQDQLHYPHPVLFVYDEILTEEHKGALDKTDFHALARKWAYKKEGCVVNLKPDRLPSIAQSKDKIVYTRGSDESLPDLLQGLHPTKHIEVIDSREMIRRLSS